MLLQQSHTANVRIDPLRLDPSRTSMLRRQFVADLRRRFRRVRVALMSLIAGEDAFGLTANSLTANTRWKFQTDAAKITAFQRWFASQVQSEIIASTQEQLENAYYQEYVRQGYEKGAARAFDDTRKPALSDQGAVADYYAGTKDEFLRSSFANPQSVDKIKQLTSRVFTDLKGIDAAMASTMTNVLADGLSRGDNPRTMARNLAKRLDVGRKRAETIARTEVIRAHAEGQLDALEKLGVTEIGVMVEWSAAYDDRTCPLCQDMDGVILTLKEARGIIPRHPNCRCAYIPANVGEAKTQQKRSAASIQEAIDRSLRREMPKGRIVKLPSGQAARRYKDPTTGRFTLKKGRTLEEQRAVSQWAGADLTPSKRRPTSILDKAKPTKPYRERKVEPTKLQPKSIKSTKIKPKPKPKPKPKAGPVVSGDSRLADPKIQSMISEYEQIRKAKLPPRLKEQKLKKVQGKLHLRGVKQDPTTHRWYDTSQPEILSPTAKSPKPVSTKPIPTTTYDSKYHKWKSGLSTKDREAIEYWSTDVYTVQSVREAQAGKQVAKEVMGKTQTFDKAMQSAPKYRGTVYRGQSVPEINKLKVGDSFEFGHAVSTSKKLDVAEEFAQYSINDATLLEIRTSKGVDISDLVLEEYRDQAEVYLRSGRFRIVSKRTITDSAFEEGRYTRVTLEEIGPTK